MTCTVIAIGDELLIGQIVDTNSTWIGKTFSALGVEVNSVLRVGDEKKEILEALLWGENKSDIVILMGGLGPTKDDITKVALGEYFNVPLEFNQSAFTHLESFFHAYGKEPNQLHYDQCKLPKGCTQLTNSKGTAQGMLFKERDTLFLSVPGVPYEMKAIISEQFISNYISSDVVLYNKTILTLGVGESTLAQQIEDVLAETPSGVAIAYLPHISGVRLRVSGKGTDKEVVVSAVEAVVSSIEEVIGAHIYGYDDDTMVSIISDLLIAENKTLATAESCTGGKIAASICERSGASSFFNGGIVAYSNYMKENILGVHSEILDEYGAVSEETVREMVRGALSVTVSNCAIAVSGIAGPGGGTEEKPVGTICIAVGDATRVVSRKFHFRRDRKMNIESTVFTSLNMLREFLLEQ